MGSTSPVIPLTVSCDSQPETFGFLMYEFSDHTVYASCTNYSLMALQWLEVCQV